MSIGKRDLETFFEPYNESMVKALAILKEEGLDYSETDLELLTLAILVDEHVATRHKHQL